jgi:hypothetical protein
LPAAAALIGGLAMVWSNPGPADFEEFAGERLVDLIAEEVCQGTELPLVLHLLVRDCPGMIRSQRKVLGRLAAQETTRYNAGLFSLYVSELGGQELLGRLPIPRYRALTLAGAGQLVVLQAGIAGGDLNAP